MTLGQVLSGLLTIMMALPVFATVSNVAVSGVSAYDNTTTPTVPVIFGGYTGPIGDCSSGGNTLCNACTAATNVCDTAGFVSACAENSIQPDLLLTVQFTVDQVPAGATQVSMKFNNGNQSTITATNAPALVAGGTITAQFPWSAVCSAEGMPGCEIANGGGQIRDTITVGIADTTGAPVASAAQQFSLVIAYNDPTYKAGYPPDPTSPFASDPVGSPFITGCNNVPHAPFCDYSLGNDDSRVYVNDLQRNTVGTTDGYVKWNSARFYFIPYTAGLGATATTNGFCGINIASASYADLFVTDKVNTDTGGSSGVATNMIKGLSNDIPYVFLLATQDETTIVSYFMDQGQFVSNAACAAGAVDGSCPYIGYPGQVVGLLDDQKCFIATAAWGSPMEPQVMLLRQFRNQFLLTNPLGTWFVHTYYRLSPPLAHWIARHETARTVARTMLWPLVWMADAMIDHSRTYFSTPLKQAVPAKAAQ